MPPDLIEQQEVASNPFIEQASEAAVPSYLIFHATHREEQVHRAGQQGHDREGQMGDDREGQMGDD